MIRLMQSLHPHLHLLQEPHDISPHLPLLKRFNSNPAQQIRVQVHRVHQNRIGVPMSIPAILFPCRKEGQMVHLPSIHLVPNPNYTLRVNVTPISRAKYNHSPIRIKFKSIRSQDHILPSHGWKIIINIYTNTYTKTNNRPNAPSVVLLRTHLLVHPSNPSHPYADHMAPMPLAHI
jgi:hypothetical protein